ncbi:MAG: S8 family serine peptidase [Bacteriovoracaceae bacterium]
MKLISAALAMGLITSAQAATIAVVDSGMDYKHEMIVPNLWVNPNEVLDRRDNDKNGYQDDINGWNFAEKNSSIIDYKYLGTFSADPKKFFDIQGKAFLGEATESEIEWMKSKREDKAFIKEMGIFGNFVHGTHVAGISIRNSQSKVMGIKLLPTSVQSVFSKLQKNRNKNTELDRWALMGKAFEALATQQMKALAEISRYIASQKADVMNGSFGTGFPQGMMLADKAFKVFFFREATPEELKKATTMLLNSMVAAGPIFVNSAPNTLFVLAAGNDGLSNDIYPNSPSNIKADNVISVAATYQDQFIAPFSNYGTKTVDIAAPGMLIKSAIPGNDYLQVSGTSQAAPYISNVAAKIKDANPSLKPADIKKILMGTVDKKSFLADKVAAGGIVNAQRAVVAAQMSKMVSLSEAISRANTQVKSKAGNVKKNVRPFMVTPIPLSPMFQ